MMLKLGVAAKKAVEEILNQGLVIAPTQSVYPVPQSDLTLLDSEELSRLFSQLTAWTNYVATQLSAAQIDERCAEKQLETETAKRMILQPTSIETVDEKGKVKRTKIPVSSLKSNVTSSVEIEKLSKEVEVLYAYRKMIEVMFSNLERDSNLISRELTRRASDFRANRQDKSLW